MTQITFEGLIDEVTGIRHSAVTLSAGAPGGPRAAGGRARAAAGRGRRAPSRGGRRLGVAWDLPRRRPRRFPPSAPSPPPPGGGGGEGAASSSGSKPRGGGAGGASTLLNSSDPYFQEFRDLPYYTASQRCAAAAGRRAPAPPGRAQPLNSGHGRVTRAHPALSRPRKEPCPFTPAEIAL
jgi:hypothetical protein